MFGLFDFNGDGSTDALEAGAAMGFFAETLSDSGVNVDELDGMDEDERREALEEAGLDPDDFEF